jgi:hypothetical protein
VKELTDAVAAALRLLSDQSSRGYGAGCVKGACRSFAVRMVADGVRRGVSGGRDVGLGDGVASLICGGSFIPHGPVAAAGGALV